MTARTWSIGHAWRVGTVITIFVCCHLFIMALRAIARIAELITYR